MTSSPAVTLRRATPDDLPGMLDVDGRAFGFHYSKQERKDVIPTLDLSRFLLAVDDGVIVGITGSYGFDVTPPGGPPVPTEGVTWVSVTVTHRRRGILRALFTEQHRGFVADGAPFSVLTASEGGIYSRFGYGPAVPVRTVEIDRRRAVFRAGVPDPGGVRHVDTPELATLGPDLHARWCATTPGAVSRSPAWWQLHLLDREETRGGASALFHLVHADGYVSYRIADHATSCRITEMFTMSTDAHAALWRALLAQDLVDTITTRSLAADDPLPFLLTDPRRVRPVQERDGMWARILDVPAALTARRYGVEIDTVLEVHDGFLGRGGRFRLRGGPDGAECTPTDRPADVHVEMAALGALYLGGVRLRTLIDAGLAHATHERLVRHLDAAWPADRVPRYGTEF